MKLTVNGHETTTEAQDLAALLAEKGYGDKVATALNGTFVAAANRASTILSPGDLVEVVAPMQGG